MRDVQEIADGICREWGVPTSGALSRDIAAALHAEREARGWQPMATAPKDGTRIRGYIDGYEIVVHLKRFDPPFQGHSEWWVDDDDSPMLDPSHWQHLSPAPTSMDTE